MFSSKCLLVIVTSPHKKVRDHTVTLVSLFYLLDAHIKEHEMHQHKPQIDRTLKPFLGISIYLMSHSI